MIKEYDVIKPPTQAELARELKKLDFSCSVLKLVVQPQGDELSQRRMGEIGQQYISMSVDSIHEIMGTPFVLGKDTDCPDSTARLEVIDADGAVSPDDRALHLSVFTP